MAASLTPGRASLLLLWAERVAQRLGDSTTLPITSAKLDDLAQGLRDRAQRDACGYTAERLFTADAGRSLVGVRLQSDGACTVAVTGIKAIPAEGLTVEQFGPDTTTWVQLPGGGATTTILVDLPPTAADCTVAVSPPPAGGHAAGQSIMLTLQATQMHPLGVIRAMSDVPFLVNITGPAWTEATITELAHGSYSMHIVPPIGGTYNVAVTLHGVHVGSSPYTFSVGNNPGSPTCHAHGSILGTATACSCGLQAPRGTGVPSALPSCQQTCADGGGGGGGGVFDCCSCTCQSGYYGVACADECPGGAAEPCNGRGVCDPTAGTCKCSLGFYGADCSGVCPGGAAQPCSGHGICGPKDGRCACSPGYWGMQCESECPGSSGTPCSGHGTCAADSGTCTCDLHYFGADCASYCHTHHTCSGHGQCTDSGTCKCSKTYTELDCSVGACGDENKCSGHGTCMGANCQCDAGYYGSVCADACPGWNSLEGKACSGHGGCGDALPNQCCANGVCYCQQGWWGEGCSLSCDVSRTAAMALSMGKDVRVRLRVLLVITRPGDSVDADALALARTVLQAAGTQWDETTVSTFGQLDAGTALYDSEGIGRYSAVVVTSPPSRELATLDDYERHNAVRRVVLSSTPPAAGLATVAPATVAVAMRVPATLLIPPTSPLAAYRGDFADDGVVAAGAVQPAVPGTNSVCVRVDAAVTFATISDPADVTAASTTVMAAAVVVQFPDRRSHLHFFVSQRAESMHSLRLGPTWLQWVTRGTYVGRPWRSVVNLRVSPFCSAMAASPEWQYATLQPLHLVSDMIVLQQQAALLPPESTVSVEIEAPRVVIDRLNSFDSEFIQWREVPQPDAEAPSAGSGLSSCQVQQLVAATATTCGVGAGDGAAGLAGCSSTDAAAIVLTDATSIPAAAQAAARSILGHQYKSFVFHPAAMVVDASSGASVFTQWVVATLSEVASHSTFHLHMLPIKELLTIHENQEALEQCAPVVHVELDAFDQAVLGVYVQSALPCEVSMLGFAAVRTVQGAVSSEVVEAQSVTVVHTTGGPATKVMAAIPVKPHHCTVDVDASGVVQTTVGVPSEFTIRITHPLGELWEQPGLVFEARVACLESETINYENLLNAGALGLHPSESCHKVVAEYTPGGTYKVTFVPDRPGDHMIHITLDGGAIEGSPFRAAASYSMLPRVALGAFAVSLLALAALCTCTVLRRVRSKHAGAAGKSGSEQKGDQEASEGREAIEPPMYERVVQRVPPLTKAGTFLIHTGSIREPYTSKHRKFLATKGIIVVDPMRVPDTLLAHASRDSIVMAQVDLRGYARSSKRKALSNLFMKL